MDKVFGKMTEGIVNVAIGCADPLVGGQGLDDLQELLRPVEIPDAFIRQDDVPEQRVEALGLFSRAVSSRLML